MGSSLSAPAEDAWATPRSSPGGFPYLAEEDEDEEEIAYAQLAGGVDRDSRDRSPDGVEADVTAPPRRGQKSLRRNAPSPAWLDEEAAASSGSGGSSRSSSSSSSSSSSYDGPDDLNAALARAKRRASQPKLRKSVSFHETVTLVRTESLTSLGADEKGGIWYRNADYSKMVTAELARRRVMGVTSTSLIMASHIAHCEPCGPDDDDDVAMDHWTMAGRGCPSDDDSDPESDDGAENDGPIQMCG